MANPPQHGPNSLRNYMAVHETVMNQLRRSDFIREDTLALEEGEGFLRLGGHIACKGGIVITVNKILEILEGEGEDAMVQTAKYSYHVQFRGGNSIFRYDNAHSWDGHADSHHKHLFDSNGVEEENSPIWVGEAAWPKLNDVIHEVVDWYCDNMHNIADPDVFPDLNGLRDFTS